MLTLLELDPNVVRPGWTPLLILVGLGIVMYLLFRSMRRQFRRVHENFPTDDGPAGALPDVPEGSTAPEATTGPTVGTPAAEDTAATPTATTDGEPAHRP